MLCPYTHRAQRENRDHGRRRIRPPHPACSLGSQDTQHLLDFRPQLSGVAEPARSVARGTQPVPQPLHVVGHGALYTGGAQRLGEAIAIAGERIGNMAPEHRQEFSLEAAQWRQLGAPAPPPPPRGPPPARPRAAPAAAPGPGGLRGGGGEGGPPPPPPPPAPAGRR